MCTSRSSAVEKSSVVAGPDATPTAVKWRVAVIALSTALAISFLVLSRFEPRFFLVHLYEALIYVAIVSMTAALDDRWLYAFGMLAPAGWLLLGICTSGFGSIARQLDGLIRLQEPNEAAVALGILISCISLASIVVSANGWRRQVAGSAKGMGTLIIALSVVIAYDAGLLLWLWRTAQNGTGRLE